MGSKNRYSKYLLPIILKDRKEGQWYVEPFVGGANMIDKVNGKRIASDINKYLIEMFRALQKGWSPPNSINEDEYQYMRNHKDEFAPELMGFVSIGCSFSGKEWGGYARGNDNNGNSRNYCLESKRNLLKQKETLKDVIFYNKNYWELDIPDGQIWYCDKPYENTTSYNDKFDHKKFWDWARNKSVNNQLFVSEYNAPDDFECLWEKSVVSSLDHKKIAGSVKTETERLFKYKY
jgi:DNA adenine methylase